MTAFFAFEIPIHHRNMSSIDGSARKRGALDRSEASISNASASLGSIDPHSGPGLERRSRVS